MASSRCGASVQEAPQKSEVREVVDILRERGPTGQPLFWVFGVSAQQLRGLLDECPICVIDDTDCGQDRHQRHAVLGGCELLNFRHLRVDDLSDPTFQALRRALHEVFKRNQIWEAEAA